MTELRPLLAILGLLVVAGAIFIGIARLRGWRFEWWERFLSPGRTRRSGAGSREAASRSTHGAPGRSDRSVSPSPAGSRRPNPADSGQSAADRSGKRSDRHAPVGPENLPLFNPNEGRRVDSLDQEFDMGDLGAIEVGPEDEVRPRRAWDAPPDAPVPKGAEPGTRPRPRSGQRPGSEPRRPSPREEPRPERMEVPGDEAGSGELLVVLTILSPEDREIPGPLLREALAAFDLQPDDHGMFHHYGSRRGPERDPVFSVANVMEPGVFDLAEMDELTTPGLCLFLRRPGPLRATVAFDLMLDVGSRLARATQAVLCDQQRCRLTVQATQALRERVVHFALRHERGAADAK